MTITDNRTEALEALQRIQGLIGIIGATRGYGQAEYDLCEVVRKQLTKTPENVSKENSNNDGERKVVLEALDNCFGMYLGARGVLVGKGDIFLLEWERVIRAALNEYKKGEK